MRLYQKTILEDVNIHLYKKDRICLIGRNGCGKSTLMKVIDGNLELEEGEIFYNVGISSERLRQDIDFIEPVSIYNFIAQCKKKRDDAAIEKHEIDIILDKLQIDGHWMLSECSGGQIRRAYLAKVLIQKPDILLLDEPTNHLDIATIGWLEEFIKSYPGSVICISHDRAFLTNVTNKIWLLDRGVIKKTDQGFRYFDDWYDRLIAEEERILNKLNKKLQEEKDWLSAGVTARRKRNQRRLKGLQILRQHFQQQAQKLQERKNKIADLATEKTTRTKFVIEVINLSLKYHKKNIIESFNCRIVKGEKIGIIGANGSGKSTLLKALIGKITPSKGRVELGVNTVISYIDQNRVLLKPELSIQETLCETGSDQVFVKGRYLHVAAYLKQFMFDPAMRSNKVATLSGGEAARLALAKTLIAPGNLLILDEPTNDLDMDSLEVLLEILSEYDGTLILVSHDRDFVNRLVTRTWVLQPDSGKIIDIFGGYDEYQKLYSAQNTELKIEDNKNNKNIEYDSQQNQKPAGQKSKKLSYNEKFLLESIPDKIKLLEAEILELEKEIFTDGKYNAQPMVMQIKIKDLNQSQQEVERLFQTWIDLEQRSS
ncbi:ABC transporter ATP-binding protein [Rickettsiales endosymbiont of Paramecium tredecaurelia]|nr:ABC-F family ATP-binding cassette domain-containing protein [Candidatus Sarmatiella mevalonica]MBL3284730.1 ABC transporter ATP-binding protein [Candidatus Sarmatiella mevalonica]